MPLSVATTRTAMADYWASLGTKYSLHAGDPGAAGTANEATGSSYARQDTVWNAAVGNTVTGSQIVFLVDAGTYTHVCRWSSGGVLRDIIDTTDAVLSPAGEVKFNPSYSQS